MACYRLAVVPRRWIDTAGLKQIDSSTPPCVPVSVSHGGGTNAYMDKRIVNHSRKIRTNKSGSILLGIARHRVFPQGLKFKHGYFFYIRVLLAVSRGVGYILSC
jgi:hypothetical protein